MTQKVIDSRICVKSGPAGFSVDRKDISIEDTREVLQRVLLFMRLLDLGVPATHPREVMDSFSCTPDEPTEQPKVCIAYNEETHQIQTAVIGLDIWHACVLVDHAVAYFNALILGVLSEGG